LVKAVGDQKNIAGAVVHDATSKILGLGWKPEPALTAQAQIGDALNKKAQLVTNPAVKSILDYNAQQSVVADKYTWPQSNQLPESMWGQPIDKTTISAYMHYLYPAYDPQKAVDYAVANKQAAAQFIHNVARTDPEARPPTG
jgi:hypothetical protein